MSVDPNYFGISSFTFPTGSGSVNIGEIVESDFDHSPADILRHALVNLGIGTLPDEAGEWPISCSVELPSPDNTITTFDTEGLDQGVYQLTGEVVGPAGIQLQVRCSNENTGWRKANQIFNTLTKGIYDVFVTIDSVTYLIHSVSTTSDILPLGPESPTSKRRLFTLNTVCNLARVIEQE